MNFSWYNNGTLSNDPIKNKTPTSQGKNDIMLAGVIIAYDTENYLSNVIWLLVVSKLLYPIWKKAFFHERLREFMIECAGTRYSVRYVPDSWLCPRGQQRTIKNNKLASLFWKTKYFICLFRDIYLFWYFKGANLFDISFYWIYEWRRSAFVSVVFCANITFPLCTSLLSLAENPWPQVLLKMMNMCLLAKNR